VIRGDARRIPLADESVDLIIESGPYWGLRSYRDGGSHYDGQMGSEPHPQLWLENYWAHMKENWRVLKPTGSCWINLGDKRAGSGGHNNWHTAPIEGGKRRLRERAAEQNSGPLCRTRNAPDRYEQAAFGRPKSKMLLPHRFAIGCEDGLADPDGIGWIVRQDQVIAKLNGLPESVTDRTRDSHEMFFHMVKQERYFSATDEIRERYTEGTAERYATGYGVGSYEGAQIGKGYTNGGGGPSAVNPLGKLPGSVWSVASEPFIVPPDIKARYDLPDHFAAFVGGTELVRRIMLGWSPHAICLTCGEGRRPVVERSPMEVRASARRLAAQTNGEASRTAVGGTMTKAHEATILGYSCACGVDPDEPSRPAVVLDPFVGSGTTLLVANALGRTGIGLDLSADYTRLAAWRASQRSEKVVSRTWAERQGSLL
jgi:hypothetical protein